METSQDTVKMIQANGGTYTRKGGVNGYPNKFANNAGRHLFQSTHKSSVQGLV